MSEEKRTLNSEEENGRDPKRRKIDEKEVRPISNRFPFKLMDILQEQRRRPKKTNRGIYDSF